VLTTTARVQRAAAPRQAKKNPAVAGFCHFLERSVLLLSLCFFLAPAFPFVSLPVVVFVFPIIPRRNLSPALRRRPFHHPPQKDGEEEAMNVPCAVQRRRINGLDARWRHVRSRDRFSKTVS
jgi:hypothetical protein